MSRVPVVRIDDVLVATVLEEVRDSDAVELQDALMSSIEATGARGVLLDLSVVETVDSFLGRLLSEVAVSARLLGANTVVVGLRPAVAITLVELGLSLHGVHTALDSNKGMRLLRALIAREEAVWNARSG